MFFLALVLLQALIQSPAVQGQTSNVTCTAQTEWEFNSRGESPCLVWVQLQSLCTTGGVGVDGLPDGYHYNAPSASGEPSIDNCNCNVVCYNLMAACSYCQPTALSWLNETQWAAPCTSYDPTGISGVSGLQTLDIPSWAYLPDNGGPWSAANALAAYRAAQTSSATPTPASTTSSTSTSSSSSTSTSSPAGTTSTTSPAAASTSPGGQGGGTNNTNGTNHTGAIVGGVVGGVAAIAIIAGLLFYLMRRNRTPAAQPAYAPAAVEAPGSPGIPTLTGSPTVFGSEQGRPMSQFSGAAPAFATGGMYGQPAFGDPYASDVNMGKYTGLPEAS